MLIRALTADDMERLSELYCQFWREASDVPKMKASFHAMQGNRAYILLGAEEDGKLAGSVMGVVCQELYGDCAPFLVVEDMIVDEGQRKRGVGRLLFEELEKQAVQRGCAQVILVTEADRKDACGFYESLGFHPTANRGYKKKLGGPP
jgi:ribosomal protein S18 acetylase RimI-like enzyme